MATVKPLIFEYDNYRVYLQDWLTWMKASQKKISFRNFSRLAGFRSPNFLKLVIEKKRNISPTSIDKFSQVLKLNKQEGVFFRNLVLLNQSLTLEERSFYAEQLLRSRFFRKVYPLKSSEFAYYSHWYFIPLRELVGLKNFREDPEWIARQLTPPISTSEAKKALEEMEKLGLLKRNETGKLIQANHFVSTGDEVSSASIAQFHREMIKKGAEALDQHPAAERDISSVTLSLSANGAQQVKELIQRFRKELLAIGGQDQEASRVYQVNFQYFPLSIKKKEGNS